MNAKANLAIHASIIGLGALTMAMVRPVLATHETLDFPANPLGINRSPYGEVAAMAMQTPIDTLWHQGALAKLTTDTTGNPESSTEASCPHGTTCSHPGCQSASKQASAASGPWNHRFMRFLEKLDHASTARTNRMPASPAHDLYIRRQVEDKLRFAYRLDPSHYGNYNSLHFFLTEPAVGTRRILTPDAARLANETINYCLAEPSDPRPSLTAAAAATNVLHLMFSDQQSEKPYFTPAQMRECLDLLNHAIATHLHLRKAWIGNGHANLISPMRMSEMDERLAFVLRIRDAAEPTVARFETSAEK